MNMKKREVKLPRAQKTLIVKGEISDFNFIDDVMAHYKSKGRHSLMWRKNITAYRILVSEVMLQQTQVTRVLPKFECWMKQFPTLAVLKETSFKNVLILWQGLGYQRRAKALLAIAKQTARLPKSYDELLLLPGIGPYTASALCAFAYNTFEHPVLETNIRTALIEYFHQGEITIHDGVLYDDLSRLVSYARVQRIGARHFYYALMDFGAYLKTKKISHNSKSAHYVIQTTYKGSTRELRAKVLFSITHSSALPVDERVKIILEKLIQEKYIYYKNKKYHLIE